MSTDKDNFLDDMEMNTTEELFNKASDYVQSIADQINSNILLELYGLYKQSTVGKCNTIKPSFFNMRASSKWNAWNDLKDMPQTIAMDLYIEKLTNLYPNWCDNNISTNNKRKEQWVSVSTHQIEQSLPESEKTCFDYVKEGNNVMLLENLNNTKSDIINIKDTSDMGLIHWASDRGNVIILENLLKHGADVNLQDSDGQTALHYASSCGHLECVKLLIKFGADRLIKDNDSTTCLDVAFDLSISELLKS